MLSALAFASAGAASVPGAIITVDSVAIPAGGTAQTRVRIEQNEPGVGSFRVDVHYDPSSVEVTACAPSPCSIDVLEPDTVRVNGVSSLGIGGPVSTLTLEAVASGGQSQLTIDRDTLLVSDHDGEPVPGVEVHDGTVQILQTLTQGDVDCSGQITPADAVMVLQAVSGASVRSQQGCSVPGNLIGGSLWGDVNCDDSLDGLDALAIVTYASGATVAPGPGQCPAIGESFS